MKRIQIVISAEWPEGEKLEDHIARGDAGSSIKSLLAEVRPKIRDYAVGFDISEPEIVETRAPRADKGKRRKGGPVLMGGTTYVTTPEEIAEKRRAGLITDTETMQPIPESLRREKV